MASRPSIDLWSLALSTFKFWSCPSFAMYCKYFEIIWISYWQLVISMVTTKTIGYVSNRVYIWSIVALVIIVASIGILLFLNVIAILSYHGIMGTSDILVVQKIDRDFLGAIFIAPCIIFFFACVSISIIMNVSLNSHKQSKFLINIILSL